MVMSSYMDLLGMHSPWFLILFMVVPMTLAEVVLCSEIFSLLRSGASKSSWESLRKYASTLLGLLLIALPVYLVTAYIPTITWKGPIDIISIYAYVLAIIPGLLLLGVEFGILGKSWTEHQMVARHAIIVFLVVAFTHVAMIFGMADPRLGGYEPPAGTMHMMPNGQMMQNGQMMHGDMKMDPNGSHMMPDGTMMKNSDMKKNMDMNQSK